MLYRSLTHLLAYQLHIHSCCRGSLRHSQLTPSLSHNSLACSLTHSHIDSLPLSKPFFPHLFSHSSLPPLDVKSVEDMKGTDQEYSGALTQYNSSANSGGEDIELLAFQTVTGENLFSIQKPLQSFRCQSHTGFDLYHVQGSAVKPSLRI